jgi:hypothetical protein
MLLADKFRQISGAHPGRQRLFIVLFKHIRLFHHGS